MRSFFLNNTIIITYCDGQNDVLMFRSIIDTIHHVERRTHSHELHQYTALMVYVNTVCIEARVLLTLLPED